LWKKEISADFQIKNKAPTPKPTKKAIQEPILRPWDAIPELYIVQQGSLLRFKQKKFTTL
jgi:hypothetical protein